MGPSTVTSFKLVVPSLGLSYPLNQAQTIHEAKRHAKMKISASDLLRREASMRQPRIRVETASVEEWPLFGEGWPASQMRTPADLPTE